MEQQRPKRKCAEAAEAAMKKLANSNGDSDDQDDEGSDTEWVQKRGDEEHEEDDSDEDDEEESDRNSSKNKREVYNALARDLGIDPKTMGNGVAVMLHAGSSPSFLGEVYTKKGIEGKDSAKGLIRSAVMDILGADFLPSVGADFLPSVGLFGGVALSASEWANTAVDKLAAVMGGGALKVFREINGWNAALHTFIALRLASVIAEHSQVNTALQTGLQLKDTLQMLAAKKFLETAMGSIRREVGSEPKEVASTILRSLAEEYKMHKTIRTETRPRSREVDMTLPKGFALNFGVASHIYTQPLLHLVIINEQGRIASVLSNERYGSKPISMGTAARETLRLLDAGPLTREALKKEVDPEAQIYLYMTSKYAGDHTSKCIRFGTTKYGQRRPMVDCVRFKTRDLRKALGVPKYSQHLFSPHYDVSRKGKPLAVLKITLSTCAFRTAKHINALLHTAAADAAGTDDTKAADGNKKRKSGQ